MRKQATWRRGVLAAAGLVGTAGIAVGAAGAHDGGGELARLASLFLLVHAATVVGLVSINTGSRSVLVLAVATILIVGVSAFASELALIAFTGSHALSTLAPLGGLLMMAGWLSMPIVALRMTLECGS